MAVVHGLLNAQGRGDTFIDQGVRVYEGMIVGSHPREGDIEINVCKEKKLTNMRSSTADVAKRLRATVTLSLEEALAFIADDELLEVTPGKSAPSQNGPLCPRPKAPSPREDLTTGLAGSRNVGRTSDATAGL